LVTIRRDATVDTGWTAQAHWPKVNGIAVDGDSLYVTLYTSPTGRIAHRSRLPDDLAVGPETRPTSRPPPATWSASTRGCTPPAPSTPASP
jgi:hypothetical protein